MIMNSYQERKQRTGINKKSLLAVKKEATKATPIKHVPETPDSCETRSDETLDSSDSTSSDNGSTESPTPHVVQKRNLGITALQRLVAVLNSGAIVNGTLEECPTFAVRPIDFINVIRQNLKKAMPQIVVERCCLYGGAATFCMAPSGGHFFNDIDLVIHVDFPRHDAHSCLNTIKQLVVESLREVVTQCLNSRPRAAMSDPSSLSDPTLIHAYISKMYKHAGKADENIWSLFSFRNFDGRNLEIKFVHTMDRCYKFSIDAWQIELSEVFLRHVQLFLNKGISIHQLSTVVSCQFPDVEWALQDVRCKVIRVENPDSVRGGCFLRFLDLIHKGYNSATNGPYCVTPDVQRLMLDRFLRDFPDQITLTKTIYAYMMTHLSQMNLQCKMDFLKLVGDRVEQLLGTNFRKWTVSEHELKMAVEEILADLNILNQQRNHQQSNYMWMHPTGGRVGYVNH